MSMTLGGAPRVGCTGLTLSNVHRGRSILNGSRTTVREEAMCDKIRVRAILEDLDSNRTQEAEAVAARAGVMT